MTFIITSPCIDLMDKACVDVCPVDCIYEAEELNQLVINPEAVSYTHLTLPTKA